MPNTIKWIVAAIVSCFATQIMATDLVSVYQAAIQNDPVYQAQKATLAAAEEAAPIARANLLPQLSLTGQLSHTYQNSKLLGKDNYNSNQYALNFSQSIFNLSALSDLRRAKKSVQAAATLFSAQEQDLMVRVVRAYLNVLQTKELLTYTLSQKNFAKDFLQMTARRHELKFATITEMDQARGQYQLLRGQEITAEINYDQAIQNLSNLTATVYKNFNNIRSTFPFASPNPNDITKWVALATTQNLALRAAQLDVQVTTRALLAKKTNFLPTISAITNYSDTNQLSTRTPENIRATEVGASASWNMLQGGLTIAQVKQANAEYQRAAANLQKQYLETLTNTHNAFIGVSSGVLRVHASQLAMQEGLAGLKHTRAGFKAGVQSIFDLLQAQNRLFEAEKQYVTQFYQYVLDTILLKQAAGTLSPKDIEALGAA